MKSTIAQSRLRRSPRNQSRLRRADQRRRLGSEHLEARVLLAGDTLAWHNAELPMDTNEDGLVTARDALVVMNDLAANGARDVDASITPSGKLDVTADGVVAPIDALKIINYLNSGAGEEHFRVRFRLAVTSVDSEDPVTTLGTDEAFLLRVYGTDLTENAGGLFAAYLDVTYPDSLADAVGPIEYSNDFQNGKAGDLSLDGLINEAGSFTGASSGAGTAETLLLSIPMTTEGALGTLTFTGDAADQLPAHEVLIFADNFPISRDDIEFVGTSAQVTSDDIVTAVDDGPFNAIEDQQLIVPVNEGVLANELNPGGVGLTAVLISDATNGTVELASDGSFTYQADANYFGPDSFSYAANNGAANSNTATVTITVAAVNDGPTATPKTYTTITSTSTSPNVFQVSVEEGLLQGASDVEGSTLTVVVTETTTNGVLTATPQGDFTYLPMVDFVGDDTFQFVVNDGELDSVPVLGTITVTAVSAAPTANPDKYLGAQNIGVSFLAPGGVLLNDTDPDGDPLTAQLETDPANGTITLNPDGSFNYVPNPDFLGIDSFTYAASDGTNTSAPATVSITIQQTTVEGLPPRVQFDEYEVEENTTLTVAAPGVLANDFDPDGDNMGATILKLTDHGTLDLSLDGSFVYTPNADFTGADTFVYTASDGLQLSIFSLVTITVVERDNRPVANGESYDVQFETPLEVSAEEGVLANDFDPDGDPITASLFSAPPLQLPANGTLTLNPDGSFIYVPDEGFVGVDSFNYLVSSGNLTSQIATARLNVQPPVSEDNLVAIRLAVTDNEGVELTTIDAGATFQLRVFVQDISPEPREGVFAAYTDVIWNAVQATVNGPIVYSAVYQNGRVGNTNTPGVIDDAGAFDGDVFLGGVERPLFSVPMVATGVGELTFTADPADSSPDTDVLLFDTLDNAVPQDRILYGSTSVTIVGLTEPVAVDDNYDAAGGTLEVTAEQGVLLNDLRVDDETLTAMLATPPSNGTLVLNPDGSFSYTGDVGFVGVDTFTYRAVSVAASSAPATVSIRVGEIGEIGVSGQVYFDTNNNGIREPHERGFGGVEILLSGTDLLGQAVSTSTLTEQDGSYSFPELLTGNYVLSQVQPVAVIDGIDSHDGTVSPTNDSFSLTLGTGDSDGYNFGERGLHPAYFGNPFYFSSRLTEGAEVAIAPGGQPSWYRLNDGWESFRSLQASLSADQSSVTITAVGVSGNSFTGTFNVHSNRNVVVLGDADMGFLVKLRGPSANFSLQQSNPVAAAVDAIFSE